MLAPNAALGYLRSALDALLPAACVVCRRGVAVPGPPICRLCRTRLPRLPLPLCRRCSAPVALAGRPARRSAESGCGACRKWPAELVMAAAPYAYESGAAVIVRSLKYGRWRSVVPAMVEDMSACGDAAVRALGVRPPAVVIPVPLSGARLRERGFNQAEELARRVAASLDHPLEPLLGREGGGRRQAGAGVDRRRQNVQGSFFMARRPEPGVRSALLVDDVLTTGATILACVDVLREAGFRRVAALTFARTLRAHQAPDHG